MGGSFVDDEYIRSVLDKYSDMVYRIALQYLNNVQDAEDITQDVFLALFGNKKFEDEQYLKAWLIRVTINKSINLCKSNLKQKKDGRDIEVYSDFAVHLDFRDREVKDALNKLDPLNKCIVYLFYFEGYSVKEISSSMKIGEKAIAKRLSRSRAKLKNYLKEGECDE